MIKLPSQYRVKDGEKWENSGNISDQSNMPLGSLRDIMKMINGNADDVSIIVSVYVQNLSEMTTCNKCNELSTLTANANAKNKKLSNLQRKMCKSWHSFTAINLIHLLICLLGFVNFSFFSSFNLLREGVFFDVLFFGGGKDVESG